MQFLQTTLTQLNQKSQELSELVQKSSNRKPVPDYQNTPFRKEDAPLSKEHIVPLQQQVWKWFSIQESEVVILLQVGVLKGKAQSKLTQFQSVQVMVHDFEAQAKSCHESLSACEERVKALKRHALSKETVQQPIQQVCNEVTFSEFISSRL